jgi:actin-related protein 3
VIDNGTGYTKMGYAGNLDPDFVFPTAIADLSVKGTMSVSTKIDEFNYYIGDEALSVVANSKKHSLIYPMKDGTVSSWDLMEKYWHQSIYNYMKCDPQEHYFVLTEPPMNPPENRENMAEIFFETFNCPGIYIGVQAVLALVGSRATFSPNDNHEKDSIDEVQKSSIQSLTGIVIDSGDGVTHVVPICDGFVIGSEIKHIPIAGRKITKFIEGMIRDRGEKINTEDLYLASMGIKEKYGYIAQDLLAELERFDTKELKDGQKVQSNKFKKVEGIGAVSGKPYKINLGYELFLGPEAFFSPEIIDKDYQSGIDELVDTVVQKCPIDYRRKLYSNIVLSGGSTNFKNFKEKLMVSIQKRVDERLRKYIIKDKVPSPIKVSVTTSMSKKNVVWLGGSQLACDRSFKSFVHTKAQYDEFGPSCCRNNICTS